MNRDKDIYGHSEQLQMFRQKAEALISRKKDEAPQFGNMEMEELMHELQVFQIELEMQNDELHLSYSELEKERTKFSGLYDLAPVGYFILDKFGAIVEVNVTGLKLMDTGRAELVGRRFQDYVSKEETDVFYNMIRKMRAFNTQHNCLLKLISASGKIYHAQLEGTGIFNRSTDPLQFYIAVIDITLRRQAEQRLVESNERLKMPLEASGTGTWEIDLKKELIYFDENSYAIIGLEPWEFNGKYDSFFKLIHPEDREAFNNCLSRAVNEEKELDTEFRVILSLKGLRSVTVKGHIIHRDGDQTRFVGIMMDVTDKKRLEHEAESLREQHQKNITAAGLQAQENERKRISEALHDSVAQLLYGIKLNLQNYNNAGHTNPKLNNTNLLLDQAITEVRNISFELAPSLLKDFGLIDSVLEMAKRLRSDNFCVAVKTQGSRKRVKPELEISAYRIIQELVNNSIKHGHATQTDVKINMMDNQVALTVGDNGTGFNMKKADYLSRGSGLLSIKNRVSLFNGNFELKTAPGKGTAVNIILKWE